MVTQKYVNLYHIAACKNVTHNNYNMNNEMLYDCQWHFIHLSSNEETSIIGNFKGFNITKTHTVYSQLCRYMEIFKYYNYIQYSDNNENIS